LIIFEAEDLNSYFQILFSDFSKKKTILKRRNEVALTPVILRTPA
jgi:hypothetical protein